MKRAPIIESLKVSCGRCTLKELCFPRGMELSDMDALDKIIERNMPMHKGEYLYQEGDDCKAIYAIRSGCVKTMIQSPSGEHQIIGFHLPGELVGFDGFAEGRHHCSAQLLETTSLCELSIEKLEGLCEELPALQRQMRFVMGQEVNNDHEQLLLLGKMTAEEKLATFLLNVSSRMKDRHWKENEFNLTMPRQDIANYLGLAVETVSRLFAQFQDNRLIDVDKRHIKILDMEALKSMTGKCSDMEHVASK